jgi:dolichol kinase
MLQTMFVVFVTFCILIYAEWLTRARQIHAELTRKLVHVAVGTFVAFWPFFLSWRQIQLLSLAFFVVVAISIKLNIFRSIHAVKRNIVGELLFAVVIGMLALILTDPWIFMAAMLHLSVADGMAAVIGVGWGETNAYKVLGRDKSVAGTTAFLIVSVCVMVAFKLYGDTSVSWLTVAWLPFLAAAAENISGHGTDNLIMPLLVALVLTSGV